MRVVPLGRTAWIKRKNPAGPRFEEEHNAPIRHLNEQFGYRPSIGRVYLKGPLA